MTAMSAAGVVVVVVLLLLWLGCCHGDADDNKQKETPTGLSEERVDSLIELTAQFSSETDGGGVRGAVVDSLTLNETVDRLVTYKDSVDIRCNASRFYTIDGRCNNLEQPLLGAAFEPFVRVLPAQYADDGRTPRLYAKAVPGRGNTSQEPLPSAREVSLRCMPSLRREEGSNLHPRYNQNLMQFGQYFSHDLALTPVMEGVDCCESLDENGFHPQTFTGEACYPISVPENDPQFRDCIHFNRSLYRLDAAGKAQQLISVTHFIDQSTVYGSTMKVARSIRTFVNGTLRTDMEGFLPQDNTQKCLLHPPLHGCPAAGDNRLNVFPGLTLTHLLFHLEHNRVARALRRIHLDWLDERLYQEARALVIAQTQNIVYREYLPLILGRGVLRFLGLDKAARYNSSVDPSIINSFNTAAFRFGHSEVNNRFQLRVHDSSSVEELRHLFFRPDKLYHEGQPMMGQFMLSLMTHPKQNVDTSFAAGVRDWLFLGVAGPNVSGDLPARNIQRGRDHGLPPYKEFLNLALAQFAGRKEELLKELLTLPPCIDGLYRSEEDVDLYLGGLGEAPMPGAMVGPTFAYLIGQQFKNLREGDRLFFDSTDSEAGFTKDQIQSIKKTTYSGLICRNFGLDRLPEQAFKIPNHKKNPMVKCDTLPDIDFTLW